MNSKGLLQVILFVTLCLIGATNLYAEDATGQSAQGAANVNDLNMYGKNISNVKEVDSETVVTKGFHDKDDPSFGVDANNISVMQKIQSSRTPTSSDDVVNKDYADKLQDKISELEAYKEDLEEQLVKWENKLSECQTICESCTPF